MSDEGKPAVLCKSSRSSRSARSDSKYLRISDDIHSKALRMARRASLNRIDDLLFKDQQSKTLQ